MSTRVLVIPGYAASDYSTQIIRSSLAVRGHKAQRWRLGRNEDPSEATLLRCRLVSKNSIDAMANPWLWSVGALVGSMPTGWPRRRPMRPDTSAT